MRGRTCARPEAEILPHIKGCYSIDTQPDPSRVIGLDGGEDRTRFEYRTSKAPHRVLPVIKSPENQDFSGFLPSVMITDRTWPEIRPCDRSHKQKPIQPLENSA
ncbi:protein of unknown function [Streptomyces murinus]